MSERSPDFGNTIAHIYKHEVAAFLGIHARESRQPTVHASAAKFLWQNRHHPLYLEDPSKESMTLAKVLDMPQEPVDKGSLFEKITRRNRFYDYVQGAENECARNRKISTLPRGDTLVKPGLLTDVITETRQMLMGDSVIETNAKYIATERNLSEAEAAQHLLANVNYNLFLAGSMFPYVESGTDDEAKMLRFLKQISEGKDLSIYRTRLQELFSMK